MGGVFHGDIVSVKGHEEWALGDEILQCGKVLFGIGAALKSSNGNVLKIGQATIDHPRTW